MLLYSTRAMPHRGRAFFTAALLLALALHSPESRPQAGTTDPLLQGIPADSLPAEYLAGPQDGAAPPVGQPSAQDQPGPAIGLVQPSQPPAVPPRALSTTVLVLGLLLMLGLVVAGIALTVSALRKDKKQRKRRHRRRSRRDPTTTGNSEGSPRR